LQQLNESRSEDMKRVTVEVKLCRHHFHENSFMKAVASFVCSSTIEERASKIKPG